jgi:hypothetical protein
VGCARIYRSAIAENDIATGLLWTLCVDRGAELGPCGCFGDPPVAGGGESALPVACDDSAHGDGGSLASAPCIMNSQ